MGAVDLICLLTFKGEFVRVLYLLFDTVHVAYHHIKVKLKLFKTIHAFYFGLL